MTSTANPHASTPTRIGFGKREIYGRGRAAYLIETHRVTRIDRAELLSWRQVDLQKEKSRGIAAALYRPQI